MTLTQTDLDQITEIAEMASARYRVVSDAALCRTGAILQIDPDYRAYALELIQAAGYTAHTAATAIVVTAVVDELALLEAQIADLTARRDRLVQDRDNQQFDAAHRPILTAALNHLA